MIKKTLRQLINRTGYDVVRTRNQHEGLQAHLRNVFAAKRIDRVLDVGANSGQYGTFLREIGFEGHIVSFEPVRSVFAQLQEAAADDGKWHCHAVALGTEPGTKTIKVYESTVFSSFLNASDYGKGTWKSLNNITPEDVQVARLDDMFDDIVQRTGCRSFYLKMDTQGFDRNVLRGALKTLGAVQALQSELSLLAVYDGMPPPYDILDDFHAQGFFISGMYPVNRDESLAVIEYDCVLVKKT